MRGCYNPVQDDETSGQPFFLFFPGHEKAHAEHGAPAQSEGDNSPFPYHPQQNSCAIASNLRLWSTLSMRAQRTSVVIFGSTIALLMLLKLPSPVQTFSHSALCGANKTTPTFGGTPTRRVHWWHRLQLNFPWHNPEGG